jgi:RNA-directed DNA polymerase
MMDGREKSDSSIVPGKPANKAAPAAAEPVEGREGAEGNADRHGTRRTQGRASVSPGLDRVREAARLDRPSQRFFVKHPRQEILCGAGGR